MTVSNGGSRGGRTDGHNKKAWAARLMLAQACGLAVAGAAHAQAVTNTYTAGTTGVWSNGANWTPAAAPTPGPTTVLEFDATAAQAYTATNDLGAFQLNGLVFNSTSTGTVTLVGGLPNFTADGVGGNPFLTQAGSGAAVVLNPVTVANPLTVGGTGTGPLTFNGGAITLTSSLTIGAAGPVTFGALSTLSGTGTLTKTGAGTLFLAGTGTYGAISLQGGTTSILAPGGTADAAALGTGAKAVTITNGATFQVLGNIYNPGSGTKTFSFGTGGGAVDVGPTATFTTDDAGQFGGAGNVFKTGAGLWILGNSAGYTYTGNFTVNAGTLRLINGAGSLGGVASPSTLTIAAGGTFDLQVANFDRPLTITGGGLNAGGALVNNGTVAASATGAVTAATGLTVGGGNTGGLTLTGNLSVAAGGLTKVGTNTVTLAPAAGSTVSVAGATAVNGGTLGLNFANNNGNGQSGGFLDPTARLSFASGGSILMTGNAAADTTQLVSGTTLSAGQATVSVSAGAGRLTILDLGTVTPAAGGAVNFVVTNGTGTASASVNNPNVNGILGGWATFGGTTWASFSVSGATGLAAFNGSTFASGNNVDLSAAASTASGATANSIRFTNTAAATLTLTGTNTVQSGGILVSSAVAANTVTITGGNLVTPTGAAQPNLFVHQNATGDATVASIIGISGNVGMGVTKTGSGRLILSAANLFTGGVFVDGGALRATNARSLGTTASTVTLAGGNLELFNDSSTNFDNNVVVASAVVPGTSTATITVNRNASTTTTNGVHRIGTLSIGSQGLTITGSNGYTLNVNGTTTLTGSPTLNVGVTTTLTGAIGDGADAFGFTKAGTGALVLAGASTFDGGVIDTAGVLRLLANSTLSGGALTSGPLGLGTLTLAGGAVSDSDGGNTVLNKIVITANTTFQSLTAGSTTGFLNFSSLPLTTKNTIDLLTANPVLTVNNTTDFFSTVTGASLTKAGTGTLSLSSPNTYTGTTTITAGVLRFNRPEAVGGAGASVTANAGGTAAAGYDIDQAFLARLATTSAGVVALAANSANDLDFSAFPTLRLGASGGTVTYSGNATFAGNAWRFGGGGTTSPAVNSVLNVGTLLAGANTVDIGANATAPGDVVLANAGNTFVGNTATPLVNAIVVNAGGVLRLTVADGAAGAAASNLGPVPTTPTANLSLAGGTIRFGTAGANLNPTRSITLGAGGGTLDSFGNNPTYAGLVTGTTGFTKTGTGTLTLTQALPNGPVTVNGSTAAANSVLNLGGNALTATALTINGLSGNNTNVAALTNVSNLTVNGPVTTGTDSRGNITVNPGGQLNLLGGTANNITLGVKTVAVTASAIFQSATDASAASAVNITGANVRLGYSASALDGVQYGLLLLPTGAGATTNVAVAAGGTFLVGGPGNNGGTTGRVVLGGGTVTVTTPALQLNDQKTNGFVAFNDGATTPTYTAGGVLSLAGLAGGRAAVSIGNNSAGGTGTISSSALDTFGGTLTGPGGLAQIGALSLGGYARGTGTSAVSGAGAGIFLIDGASGGADISSVSLAPTTGTAPYTAANTRGILVVNNGTAALGGDITNASAGSGSAVWAFGGTLSLGGNNVAGTNGLPDVGVVGGTLLNAGTVTVSSTTAFNHSGGTVARTLAGTTTITGGAYNVGSVAPTVLINGIGYGAPAVGGSTIRLDATTGGGARAVAAPSLARSAGGTLNLIPVSGGLGGAEKVTFATSPATIVTSTVNMVPAYAVAQASGTILAGDFLTHGANGLVPITYAAATDLNAATAADVFNATAPQTLGASAAALALRASAAVNLGGNTLTIGSGTNPAGLIVNGATISNGTVAFGANEGIVYAGGPSAGTLSATLSGTGGLTIFGGGTLSATANNAASLSGAVRVNGGTFAANNAAGSATGAGAVTVGSSGRLAGGGPTAVGSFTGATGFVTGAVTVNRFGTVAPGNGGAGAGTNIGTLTVGPTAFAGGSILDIEIDPAALAARPGASRADVNVNDRLAVAGTLTLTGATNYNPITLTVDGGGADYSNPNGYDFFFALASNVTGFNAAAFTVVPTNFASPGPLGFTVSQFGTSLVLTVAAVPEPSAAVAGLAAAAGLLARRRRRAGAKAGG
jgi:fibronectin-binding autotransporter adhesin